MNKDVEIELKDSERQPCEIWTRVMGYYRPVDAWNIGKKQEFADRKYFDKNKAELYILNQGKSQEKVVA